MASRFHVGDEDERFPRLFQPSPPPPISPTASRFRAREEDEIFSPFFDPSPHPHPPISPVASRFRADVDERFPPFFEPSADIYFSHQAIRAGYMGDDGPVSRPRMSLQALERELREERIREEIIARRIAQRRMVEEQAWREMEMSVAMRMGRHLQLPLPVEPLVLPPPGPKRMELDYGRGSGVRRFGSRPQKRDLPKVMIGRSSGSLQDVEIADEAPGDVEFGKRYVELEEREKLPVRDASELGAGKKLASGPEKTVIKMDEKVIPPKFSAKKRKAPAATIGNSSSKFPRPAKKEWSCALCQVSATSEEALNEHLQGRKHLYKAAQLAPKKNLATTALTVTALAKTERAAKKKPVDKGTRKVSIRVDGKLHEVTKKGRFLWCWMCNVKCTGQSAMISHLSGKRHYLLEEPRKFDAAAEGAVEKEEVVLATDKGTLQNEVVVEEKKDCAEGTEKNSKSNGVAGSEEG